MSSAGGFGSADGAPISVAAFTGGRLVPSGRFRVRQYIPALNRMSIRVTEFCPYFGRYPPARRYLRLPWACALMGEQAFKVARSHGYDVCLLQRELMSTFCTLEPLTGSPRVLDVDDAIFAYRGGRAARRIANLVDWVVCGNGYLAEWFERFCKRVSVIPTAVDTERFAPLAKEPLPEKPLIIGWVGTSGHLPDLTAVESALSAVLKARPNLRLRVVCDKRPDFALVPAEKLEFIQWSESQECENIASMDIGIMPLNDNVLTRGKCSFKMLQYMACGLPVVVSPIGMNAEVLALADVGYGANTISEWTESLIALVDDLESRGRLGTAGRSLVVGQFSTSNVATRLGCLLRWVAGGERGSD